MYREIRSVGFAVLRMLALGAVFILALPWIVKTLFQSRGGSPCHQDDRARWVGSSKGAPSLPLNLGGNFSIQNANADFSGQPVDCQTWCDYKFKFNWGKQSVVARYRA